MSNPEIVPHKITKPIQLLAAWLAGLAVINGSFLTAAGLLHSPQWLSVVLTFAAVLNVPMFIISLFLLQTKFRPEMQEDTFYSKYLERKYSPSSVQPNIIDIEKQLSHLADEIVSKVSASTTNKQEKVINILKESEISQLMVRFERSRALSEIYMYRNKWDEIVDKWEYHESFKDDVKALISSGLIILEGEDIRQLSLTPIGLEVAKRLKDKGQLWNQKHERNIPDRKIERKEEAN